MKGEIMTPLHIAAIAAECGAQEEMSSTKTMLQFHG